MKHINSETLTYSHCNPLGNGEMDLVVAVVFKEETARKIGIAEDENNQGSIYVNVQNEVVTGMTLNDGGGEDAPFGLEDDEEKAVLAYLDKIGVLQNGVFSPEKDEKLRKDAEKFREREKLASELRRLGIEV